MKTRISIFIIGLLLAFPVYAVEITPLPIFSIQETFFQKIVRCKFNIPCYFKPLLGTTVTTISGSTLISAYPTIQNANVNALNDGKIENSTTSVAAITTLSNLVTVGTLTSGSLGSGFTPVVVARGGTGSTTLSANQVLLGSTTNAINVVSGWGTSGQFLTSNGGTAAPTWQTSAVDQSLNYAWSGNHNFTGSTTIKNLTASSTVANPIYLNGVNYNTPSTQGAAGTILQNNGSGGLSWSQPDWIQRGEIVATSSVAGIEITNIATSTDMRIIAYIPSFTANWVMAFNRDFGPNAGGQQYTDWGMLNYNYTASTTNNSGGGALQPMGGFTNSATSTAYLIMDISNSSTTPKLMNWTVDGILDGRSNRVIGGGQWNDKTHSINYVTIYSASGVFGAGTRLTIYGKKD